MIRTFCPLEYEAWWRELARRHAKHVKQREEAERVEREAAARAARSESQCRAIAKWNEYRDTLPGVKCEEAIVTVGEARALCHLPPCNGAGMCEPHQDWHGYWFDGAYIHDAHILLARELGLRAMSGGRW